MSRAGRNEFIEELNNLLGACASSFDCGHDELLRAQVEQAVEAALKTWTAPPELINELLKVAIELVEMGGSSGVDDLAFKVGADGPLHAAALKAVEHAAFLLFVHHEMAQERGATDGFEAIAVAYLNKYPIPEDDYLKTLWGAVLTLGRVV